LGIQSSNAKEQEGEASRLAEKFDEQTSGISSREQVDSSFNDDHNEDPVYDKGDPEDMEYLEEDPIGAAAYVEKMSKLWERYYE
jgi:hypothetical protein